MNDTLHEQLIGDDASFAFNIVAADNTNQTSISLVLPYANLYLQLSNTYPGIQNTTRYFPLRRVANETQFTLGRAFLQNTYLIVDYERQQFSLHQSLYSASTQRVLTPILSPASTSGSSSPPSSSPAPAGLSPGAIAGIVVANIVIVSVIAAAVFWKYRRDANIAKQVGTQEKESGSGSQT